VPRRNHKITTGPAPTHTDPRRARRRCRQQRPDAHSKRRSTHRLADENPAGHVGDIQIITVDPNADHDPLAGLDTTSANLDRICQVLLAPATGRLSRAITDHIGRRRSRRRVLILHHACLSPQWRGFGLGTLLIGTAIKTVSADCRVAACSAPATDQNPRHSSYDPVDVQIAYATLGEVFEQLGFEHVSAGVFILDLTSTELDRSLAQLRTRIYDARPLGP
jgi:hypothetical protein